MSDPSEPVPEPANLRFLRRLVTTLTAVMIVGLLVIVSLLVIRFSSDPAPSALPLPESIALPNGVTAAAVTYGPDWYAIVTNDGRILIYDRATGALRQTVTIDTPDTE
ncbi:DUF6476 family protein [Sedimentitalea sp. JM2-8]|uniref:DUF6476 family protein n=1 Tax=Sedimentitalea xiamensis TaxID=3050037 RepID=A0ABT7FFM0_9RHOB|nr:DUF6476 family protein [Sedimentitalea xiamensis]MDK3073860.1 DUF6476 family protein [Sedimentitalea xiamensis]